MQIFRNGLISLLNSTQMHIYLFAFKDDNNSDGFGSYYYTDIFHDKDGILLDLESIKYNFNKKLMGVFYKVCYIFYILYFIKIL